MLRAVWKDIAFAILVVVGMVLFVGWFAYDPQNCERVCVQYGGVYKACQQNCQELERVK